MINELNKDQQAAAEFFEGVAAVVAIPGSGKTLTMANRIGILVKRHQIPPEQIIGITLTKSAAEEMRSRLIPVLGDLSSRVHLSTIHSFAYSILKREGRIFSILSGKEEILFFRNIMKKLKIEDLSIGMILHEISISKNNLISVDEFRDLYDGDKTMLKVADIYDLTEREKSKKMLMTFEDLLVETYHLLKDNKEVREKYQCQYLHLMTDEYQDSNIVCVEILKLLVNKSDRAKSSSFWFCFDDAQSIFSFIGASVNNVLNFREIFPKSEQFILNMNYRSTPQILKACQNLIQHNTKKIDKTFMTNNQDGEDIIVLEASSETSEALNLVNEITDLVERRDYSFKDIAILYRCRFQSRIIEETLSQHKIPYHIDNGLSFYRRKEVKILLDYLRVIANPLSDEGDEAMRDIINIPNRYIGRKFIRELDHHAAKKGVYLLEALRSIPIDLTYLRRNVKDFLGLLDPLIETADNLEPAETINLLRVNLDFDRWITDQDIVSVDDTKIENLNQLQLAAVRFNDIMSFLKYADTFEDEVVSDNKDGIRLSTIHASKGREFPVVFVIGLIENLLPSSKGDLEEERRVCYVSISRAMQLLYLSHSSTYLGQPARKSTFLDEILGNIEPPELDLAT